MSSITKPKKEKLEERLIFLNEEINRLEKKKKIEENTLKTHHSQLYIEINDINTAINEGYRVISKLDDEIALLQSKQRELIPEIKKLADSKAKLMKQNESLNEKMEVLKIQEKENKDNIVVMKNELAHVNTLQKNIQNETTILEKEAKTIIQIANDKTKNKIIELDQQVEILDKRKVTLDDMELKLNKQEEILKNKISEYSVQSVDFNNKQRIVEKHESELMKSQSLFLKEKNDVLRRQVEITNKEKDFTKREKDLIKREQDSFFLNEELEIREKRVSIATKKLKLGI